MLGALKVLPRALVCGRCELFYLFAEIQRVHRGMDVTHFVLVYYSTAVQ